MALFRHTVSGTFPGEAWSFGIHTLGNLTTSAANAAWVSAFGAFWTGNADALMTADITVTEIATAELDQATGKQLTKVSTGSSLVGISAGEPLPFQCAPVVSLRTNLATRAGRGRFYAPAVAVSHVVNGRLTSAAQNALLAGGVDMITTFSGAGLDAVLYSRTTHATQSIVRIDVGDVIDTQRRRRNKLAENRVTANV